jgi:hypothetical protein
MAWSRPFRRHDEHTRTCWDYTFQLTPEHPGPETFEALKFSCDTLADEALDKLNEISPPPRSALPRNDGRYAEPNLGEKPAPEAPASTPKRDLYAVLRDHAHEDPVLQKLWAEINHVPDWVDWEQLERGQDVFYRYGGPCLTGLCFQSLLGGLGATRVVETLSRTGGFKTSVARHRLYETTQHVLQVTQSLASIQPGGAGFASSVRVRLLHAAVRKRILALAASHPSYYDVAAWGVPINDLDCAGTIGTFSATLVWLALPRQGIYLRPREIDDYMALWKYVGYLTGTPVRLIETPTKARRFMESLLLHEIRPSATSRVLAGNVLNSLAAQPPMMASRAFLVAEARWLNGDTLCDELGLERVSLWYKALVAGQCCFFMGLCYFYRAVPRLDRRKIKVRSASFSSFLFRAVSWTKLTRARRRSSASSGPSSSRASTAYRPRPPSSSSTCPTCTRRRTWKRARRRASRSRASSGGT